ncbi:uncharacterized protein LOC115075482 [Rhinatrema bivittatum]|uniref:uncharacterized protein LOC115075482 n=1 Tax=Rhinatrema bivittatum TaxID=194408 RepID=UPI001129644A|nr:uncharacterized protein LOC115075482 [Rhinatrema bivittatum]
MAGGHGFSSSLSGPEPPVQEGAGFGGWPCSQPLLQGERGTDRCAAAEVKVADGGGIFPGTVLTGSKSVGRSCLGGAGDRESRAVFPSTGDVEGVFLGTSRQEAWRDTADLLGVPERGRTGRQRRRKIVETNEGMAQGVQTEHEGVRGGVECAWVVGHSFVRWAFHRAKRRPYGANLALDEKKFKVKCFFKGGMKWGQLTNFLQSLVKVQGSPAVLIIHLGGNDIGVFSCRQLLSHMRKDLSSIMNAMPGTRVGWSDIIIRIKHQKLNLWKKGVKKLNRQIGKWVQDQGGFWIGHDWSWEQLAGLFREDGVHLSDIGVDLFNNTLQESLERHLLRRGKAAGGGTKTTSCLCPPPATTKTTSCLCCGRCLSPKL